MADNPTHPAADPAPAPSGLQAVFALERRLIFGVITVTLLLLVLATGVITRAALGAFEREVLPGMGREASAIGITLAAQIERAVSLGVPVDRLVGLEAYFDATLASYPNIHSVQLHTNAGEHGVARKGPLRELHQVLVAVQGAAGPIGTLRLGIDPSQLERSATDSKWDIAIVLLVALLTTIEVLVFLADRTVRLPLQLAQRLAERVAGSDWTTRVQTTGLDAAGRFLSRLSSLVRRMNERRRHVEWLAGEVARAVPARKDEIAAVLARLSGSRFAEGVLSVQAARRSPAIARLPLFLYVFAEQLSTSFIPIFARSVQTDGGWISGAIAVGLPITMFAGMIALMSPIGAALVGRFGARLVLVAGCAPAVLGYVMTARSGSIEAFIAWRAVTAMGYALITIACQTYLVVAAEDERKAAAPDSGRGRTMAVFVYAAMTGAVCGTAIGAVLADRIGMRATFAASGALTVLAGLLAYRTMDAAAGIRVTAAPQANRKGALHHAFSSPRFVSLVVFVAMPAKLVLTGFVFTICPLFLLTMDNTQPEIGRQMMLYAATMLLTIRAGAWVADRLGGARSCIVLAGATTGLGLGLVLLLPASLAVPLAIGITGLCQGLASAPILAVVPETCPDLSKLLGLPTLYSYLRFAERIGSIAGPLLATFLVAMFNFTTAIATIGLISFAATAVFWVTALIGRDDAGHTTLAGEIRA